MSNILTLVPKPSSLDRPFAGPTLEEAKRDLAFLASFLSSRHVAWWSIEVREEILAFTEEIKGRYGL